MPLDSEWPIVFAMTLSRMCIDSISPLMPITTLVSDLFPHLSSNTLISIYLFIIYNLEYFIQNYIHFQFNILHPTLLRFVILFLFSFLILIPIRSFMS